MGYFMLGKRDRDKAKAIRKMPLKDLAVCGKRLRLSACCTVKSCKITGISSTWQHQRWRQTGSPAYIPKSPNKPHLSRAHKCTCNMYPRISRLLMSIHARRLARTKLLFYLYSCFILRGMTDEPSLKKKKKTWTRALFQILWVVLFSLVKQKQKICFWNSFVWRIIDSFFLFYKRVRQWLEN